ncbi:transposase [Dietzia cinnamea]|uniref:transposase n=1 Tax=Dietzia cinnamea TaxID=321318 RepID=UPI0035CD37BC
MGGQGQLTGAHRSPAGALARRHWSTNPIERPDKEFKRRAEAMEIFPTAAAFRHLATSVVIDQQRRADHCASLAPVIHGP